VAILYDPAAQKAVTPGAAIAVSCAHGSQDGYYTWVVNRDGNPGTVYFTDSQLMQTEIGDGGGGLFSWGAYPGVLDATGFSLVDTRAPFRADKDTSHHFAAWVELPRVRTFAVSNDVRVTNAKLVLSNCVLRIGGGMTVTDSGRVFVLAGETNSGTAAFGALVAVTREFLIASNSWVYPVAHGANGSSPLFRVNGLTIATTNAGFDADGSGMAGGSGPGGGGYRSGGGYGGRGGGSVPGVTYGLSNAPLQCGSGGGFQNGEPGYPGGGLVWLEATGKVSVEGRISARGASVTPQTQYAGGGSGGAIFIRCADFSGSSNAVLCAEGGYGGSSGAGGGGGGRIAVWYRTVSDETAALILGNQLAKVADRLILATNHPAFSGSVSVVGGSGAIGQGGLPGSVVFLSVRRLPGMIMLLR
jgi:hypothetical protein